MFIKLTDSKDNKVIYLNSFTIDNITIDSNEKTHVDTNCDHFIVKETPEQIVSLVNEQKAQDTDLLQSIIEQAIYEQRI